ncbi:MAG: Uma2 family endonuclease [Armatimonadetes bacterium]|nr:Uma2 family endonuclease [Armatimonadota bacterium]
MTLAENPRTEERFTTWTDWNGYLQILEAFKGRRIKITYDRGALELLTPSWLHESIKRYLAQLLDAACYQKDFDYTPGGSTTFRRQLLDRGLEPDECYFFSHPEQIGDHLTPEEMPPPDLAVEVEISRSSLDRLSIYQALGVPEVWCYSIEHTLRILRLGSDGYRAVKSSSYFPELPPDEVCGFVQLGLRKRSNAMLRAFGEWLARRAP